MVNLRNFTTSISAGKTVGEIDALLIEFGARNIMKKVEDRIIRAVMFTLDIHGKEIPFKIEAQIEKTAEFLSKQYNDNHVRKHKNRDEFTDEAYNIAWRIWKDWLHSQLSIITTENVEAIKLLLGFAMTDKNSTLGDMVLAGKFNNLLLAYEE